MFSDPKKVKDIKLAVRLNDYQHEMLTELADALSEHPSALARKLFMQHVEELHEAIQTLEPEQLRGIVHSSTCPVEKLMKAVKPPTIHIMNVCHA